jgi:hypothetical protein
MNDALVRLFRTLDTFIEVNVRAEWETLHEDYAFVLESTGPSAAALALDRVRLPLVASAPVEDDGSVVGAAGGSVADVVEVEVVVPKVPVAPRPKPGGSKSVPGEWNKLAREKTEAERKLAVEREDAERKRLAEEEEVEEMMDRPLEGKGKGVMRETVGLPEVATRGSARPRQNKQRRKARHFRRWTRSLMICRWRCEVLGRSPSGTGRGWWRMPSPAIL